MDEIAAKVRMNRTEWLETLKKLPGGLSGAEIARRVKQCPQVVSYWTRKLGYKGIDGRANPKPEKFDSIRRVNVSQIDWSESNNAILAKRHGISRERVRQLRQRITKI